MALPLKRSFIAVPSSTFAHIMFEEQIDPRRLFATARKQRQIFVTHPSYHNQLVRQIKQLLKESPEGPFFRTNHLLIMCSSTEGGARCFCTCRYIHQIATLEALTQIEREERVEMAPPPQEASPLEADDSEGRVTQLMTSVVDPRRRPLIGEALDPERLKFAMKLILSLGVEGIAAKYRPIVCDRSDECDDGCPYMHSETSVTALRLAIEEAKALKSLA